MRPAGTFANAMAKYSSDKTIKYNANEINGKSLMNIIAGGIKCGSEVEVICNGADEDDALAEAIALIESGFGE